MAAIRIDGAVGVLELMDYPFHLFRDRASHQDSVVVRISHGLTGAAFEIFIDKATGRGAVLYARYDGHYGMLRPAVPLWSAG